MKKLLLSLLTVIFMMTCFASCANLIHKDIPDEEWSYNELQHWKDITCTWNMCKFDVVSYDHVDENSDRVCDVCEYQMPSLNFDIKWITSETHHWYEPEPDENGTVDTIVYGYEEHIDENSDRVCDVCEYQMPLLNLGIKWITSETHHWYLPGSAENGAMFGVVYGYGEHVDEDGDLLCDVCGYHLIPPDPCDPPTNYFLRNQAGCEWLQEMTAEEIAEVKIIIEAVGVAPGMFKDIVTSEDETAIARIFEAYYWLDTWPISKEEGAIYGGGAVTVIFTLHNGTEKTLYINNGNYCDTNGNYFDLLYTPKFEETDNCVYSIGFITYQGHGKVFDANDNAICYIPMDELEFMVVVDELVLDTKAITHYVETEFGKLYFLSDIYFYIEGSVEYDPLDGTVTPIFFQLCGKNLKELIQEYRITTE